jgi:hypothetical protein
LHVRWQPPLEQTFAASLTAHRLQRRPHGYPFCPALEARCNSKSLRGSQNLDQGQLGRVVGVGRVAAKQTRHFSDASRQPLNHDSLSRRVTGGHSCHELHVGLRVGGRNQNLDSVLHGFKLRLAVGKK